MKKHRLLFTFVCSLAITGLAACGGGGDDDDDDTAGGADAAASQPDAGGQGGTPDATPQGGSALGQPCTPGTGIDQGDCPAGHICLGGLTGQTGAWCTKSCTSQTDPVCAADYTGPGLPLCIFQIDTSGDMTPDISVCGIVCEDLGAGICSTCDTSCPSTLGCTAELRSTGEGNPVVAKACF